MKNILILTFIIIVLVTYISYLKYTQLDNLNIKNIELKTMNNKLQSEIINLKIDSEIN
jgi:hypothetical protein